VNGAKYTMSFVLEMNNRQVTRSIRETIASVDQLDKATMKSIRATTLFQSRIAQYTAVSFGLFALANRVVHSWEKLTRAASAYEYQSRSLSALMQQSAGAGERMYNSFRVLNPYIKEFAPTEVVTRMKQLAQAGYQSNEILKNTGAIFDTVIASMGELSPDAAVQLGINLDRAFGTANESMRDLLDTAVAAANQFPMTVAQIGDAMGYATEAAVQYKQPLDEVLTTIGMLIPVTKTASKAGTAYRNALLSLGKDKTVKFLEKYGVQVKDNNGEMRKALDIYLDLATVLERIEKTDKSKLKFERQRIQHQLGGTRGGAMFAAVERLADNTVGAAGTAFAGRKFADRETAVLAMRMGIGGAAQGEAKRLADQLRETSQVLRNQFEANLERASTAVGTFMLPVRNSLMSTLNKLLDWVADRFAGGLVGGRQQDNIVGATVGQAAGVTTSALTAGSIIGGVLYGGAALYNIASFLTNPKGFIRDIQSPLKDMTRAARRGDFLRGLIGFGKYQKGGVYGNSNGLVARGGGVFNGFTPFAYGQWAVPEPRVHNTAVAGMGGRYTPGNLLSAFAKIGVTLGAFAGAVAYATSEMDDYARKVMDFGDRALGKEGLQNAHVTKAMDLVWKLMNGGKVSEKDKVQMAVGKWSPEFATAMNIMRGGGSYLDAHNRLMAQRREQIESTYLSPELKKKALEQLDVFEQANKDQLAERLAAELSGDGKVKTGMDRVTRDQLYTQVMNSMLSTEGVVGYDPKASRAGFQRATTTEASGAAAVLYEKAMQMKRWEEGGEAGRGGRPLTDRERAQNWGRAIPARMMGYIEDLVEKHWVLRNNPEFQAVMDDPANFERMRYAPALFDRKFTPADVNSPNVLNNPDRLPEAQALMRKAVADALSDSSVKLARAYAAEMKKQAQWPGLIPQMATFLPQLGTKVGE